VAGLEDRRRLIARKNDGENANDSRFLGLVLFAVGDMSGAALPTDRFRYIRRLRRQNEARSPSL